MKRLHFKNLYLFLLFGVGLNLYSCKKDGNGNSTSGSGSSVKLLTSARWTFLKFEYQKTDGTWIPDPDAANADKFTVGFNSDNTFSEIHLAGYTSNGTWNFSSNNTVLTTTGGQDLANAAYTVNQLNSSMLVITWLNYPTNLAYIDERLTFTH